MNTTHAPSARQALQATFDQLGTDKRWEVSALRLNVVKPALLALAASTPAKPAVLPTIHLGGTSARTLTEGYTDARQAVQTAMATLQKVEFHSRDYVPQQGQLAWLEAVRQRQELLNQLARVSHELYQHEAHCAQSLK